MKKLTISIVTPSYNQGKFIGRTLESVLVQADPRFRIEYFIFDAVSTDETDKVVGSFLSKLRRAGITAHYIREKDRGQSHAINKGLERASGDIFAYINSDDYYEPNALRQVADYFYRHPHKQWAYGGWNVVKRQETLFQSFQPTRYNDFLLRSYSANIGQPSCFFRRGLFRKAGPFDENQHLAMDYDMWLRFRHYSKPGIISHILSNLRYYSGAKSSKNMLRHNLEASRVALRHSGGNPFVAAHTVFRFILGYIAIWFGKNISQQVER